MYRILSHFREAQYLEDTLQPRRSEVLQLAAEAGWRDAPLLELLLDRIEGRP